jgi:hypothetical protein
LPETAFILFRRLSLSHRSPSGSCQRSFRLCLQSPIPNFSPQQFQQTRLLLYQIFNERQDHVFSTILAIPNYRLRSTDKTVITFKERAAGQPEALRAWFYPGNRWGQEFVYPKARAIVLAKRINLPILAMPTELASNLIEPAKSADEPPVIALKQAPIEAVTPAGKVVAMTEVVEPPPVQTAENRETLPKTASLLPLLGLVGLLSLAAGAILWLNPKRLV